MRSGISVELSEARPSADFWWADAPASVDAHYTLEMVPSDGAALSVELQLPAGAPLLSPELQVDSEGRTLTWAEIAGAAEYQCLVSQAGAIQLDAVVSEPLCDLTALPSGTYTARVLAFGLASTAEPQADRPFHVSEAGLAFITGASADQVFHGAAVGGAIEYGGAEPGLALGLAFSGPDGGVTTEDWDLEVLGPGISSTSPLNFFYPAGAPRMVGWSYEVPSRAGRYSWTARSATRLLAGDFFVGEGSPMAKPWDVVVSARASGGATIDFGSVVGASAYYVSVWEQGTGAFTAGQWTQASPAIFPAGTFTAGVAHEVYVAASNVDVTRSEPLPDQVRLSENTFLPTVFVAE